MAKYRHGLFEDTVEIDGEEVTVEFAYAYYPGERGRMYMNNGDPGYPDEPEDAEITGFEIKAVKVYVDKGWEEVPLKEIPKHVMEDLEKEVDKLIDDKKYGRELLENICEEARQIEEDWRAEEAYDRKRDEEAWEETYGNK